MLTRLNRDQIKSALLTATGRNPDIGLPKTDSGFEPELMFNHDTIAIFDDVSDQLFCVTLEGSAIRFSYWATRLNPPLADIVAALTFAKTEAITKWGTLPFVGVFSNSCPYLIEHGETRANITKFITAWTTVFPEQDNQTIDPPISLGIEEVDSQDRVVAEHGFERAYFRSGRNMKFRAKEREPVIGDAVVVAALRAEVDTMDVIESKAPALVAMSHGIAKVFAPITKFIRKLIKFFWA